MHTKHIAGVGKESFLNCSWECAKAKVVVLADGLGVFRPEAVTGGGKMIPSGNMSFHKRTLIGWTSGI
jgi:hypothetical protein